MGRRWKEAIMLPIIVLASTNDHSISTLNASSHHAPWRNVRQQPPQLWHPDHQVQAARRWRARPSARRRFAPPDITTAGQGNEAAGCGRAGREKPDPARSAVLGTGGHNGAPPRHVEKRNGIGPKMQPPISHIPTMVLECHRLI